MNRQEAVEALEKGETLKHVYFPKKEFIKQVVVQENFYIEFHDGYQMDYDLFWKNRQTDDWDKDWSIILI